MNKPSMTGGIAGALVGLVGLVAYLKYGFSYTILFLWIVSTLMIGVAVAKFLKQRSS